MLEEILAPVPSSLVESHKEEGTERIGSWIQVHDELEGMPDWEEAHLCILGVCEDRGKVGDVGQALAIDSIRRELYDLFREIGHSEWWIWVLCTPVNKERIPTQP